MAEVTVDNVSRVHVSDESLLGGGRRAALDAVSLTIADGETVSLVGPSGSGKSTLLRVIAGLDRPDAGRVRYDGTDVTELAPGDRDLGMVFQDYALYPSMKGKGNLQYYFDTHGQGEDEAEQRVRETARVMGIDFELLLGRLPDQLSGGQKQRVAIARCIVRHPRLFLMDEPICNLDAKLREQTRLELKKLLNRFSITTVYVTHDQQEAIFMADRIVVLRDGRIEQVGAFDELYYRPANAFVASFIGSPPMALLPAHIGTGQVFVGHHGWPLPDDCSVPDGEVRLGVRPESWRIGTPGGVRFDVRRVERLPAERLTLLRGTVGSTDVTVAADPSFREGSTTTIEPDPDGMYLFDVHGAARHTPGVPDLF
ncbi:ABC transporter ATP-binding protein [Micromonospora sp. NPDC051300]|uniref:ABC transporter ATP-binding protein n=1 Tax=Micromonospora sp. NPDC051300 TaxID=3364286 RepID=UPI00379D2E0C